MKPRLLHAALVALLLTGLLALTGGATAHADDEDPSSPTSTSIPEVDGDDTGGTSPVTVGIQTATSAGLDDRGKYEYELEPKAIDQDWIAVFNYSNKPVDVSLTARDATTTSDSPFAVQPNDAKATDVGTWIALDDETLHLGARTRTLVPFQVGVPYDATPGDHIGAIVLTILTEQADGATGDRVTVQNRVGLRVYVRVPGALRPALEVDGLSADFGGTWGGFGIGTNTVDYTVRNTGNVTLSGTQVIDMLRSFGLSSLSRQPDDITEMLPGGEIGVHEVSGRFFAVGDLTTRVTLTPKRPENGVDVRPATAEVTQFVVPWALLLSIVLAIALIALLVRIITRWRRHQPPRVKNPAHRRAGPPGGPEDVEPATDLEAVGAGTPTAGTEEQR